MAEQTPNFEDDMKQLSLIVEQLDHGDLPLEDAITAFQSGIALSDRLQVTLNQAQDHLNQVVDDDDQVHPLE